jgi:putative transposase
MLMCDATGLSQRRACRLTGLSLSTCRYEAHRPAADAHLSGRITELALERRRFGYRRIWQLLRREGLHVNHKRVRASECTLRPCRPLSSHRHRESMN